ncbi:hypothetical protein ACLI4U_04100 [Natrialbaceae archaeon A-CW2]
MTEESPLTRRQLLATLGGVGLGLGVVGLGAMAGWSDSSAPTVQTDDDDMSLYDIRGDESESPPPGETEPKQTAIEISMPKGDLERFNSNSVSFRHDGFFVCNRGKEAATVWIDADPPTNDRGEPAVRFYTDGDLGNPIDSPKQATTLEPDSCLTVGIMTRTMGISGETTLLEEVYVRSERES